jgi:quinol monooxygenase YgiN
MMYGTVARMRIKPGMEDKLLALVRSFGRPPGLVMDHVYRMDADPAECYVVVAFASKDAYLANAARPETHAEYLQFRELLTEEPVWHDGEIEAIHAWEVDSE